jgi:hypothetical protein
MRNERRILRRRWQFDFGAPIASRCVKGLVDLVNELEVQKVHFQSITDGIDTKASLAQMERELHTGLRLPPIQR